MDSSSLNELNDLLLGIRIETWSLVKWPIVLGLFLYLWFAVMIVRQIELMSRSLNGAFQASLKLMAWLYLFAAVGVFLSAVLFL